MGTIEQDLAAIRTAVYGKDVREAIADGIENCYNETSLIGYSQLNTRVTSLEHDALDEKDRLDTVIDNVLELGGRTTSAENDIDSLTEDLNTVAVGKVDISQGSGNAGKALVVGADGNVTLGNAAENKKYLFIGDSYAEGYSHDGNNSGWCRYLVDYIGLSASEYVITYHGGWGFANGGFTSLVQDSTATEITDVVACGGYNENNYTEEQILTGMAAFVSAVQAKWTGAKVRIGFIAYNKEGNGSGAIDEWAEKRKKLMEIVLPAYQKCTTLGCEYLTNVESWLREDGLTPSDGYHPSAEGNQAIARAVSNALLTGSAPLPNERYELTREIKLALLKCLEKIPWIDGNGKIYYRALADALHISVSNRRPELPDAYEQVEYIQATRAQYIILNDILSQVPFTAKVKASFELGRGPLVTSGLSSDTTSRFFLATITNNRVACRIGNNNWLEILNGDAPAANEICNIVTTISSISGGVFTNIQFKNEQATASYTAQTITGIVGNPINIFRNGSDGVLVAATLYEIVLSAGGTILFDGIPCYRKSDEVAGLYNAVSGAFYTNDGTGSFVVGEVVE